MKTEYDADGMESGLHVEWNRFGRQTKVFRYDGGQLDDVCETYNPDTGFSLETAVYRNGQQHGLYVLRYKNGTPKLIRVFKYQREMLTKWISRSGKVQTLYPPAEKTKLGMHSESIRHEQRRQQHQRPVVTKARCVE